MPAGAHWWRTTGAPYPFFYRQYHLCRSVPLLLLCTCHCINLCYPSVLKSIVWNHPRRGGTIAWFTAALHPHAVERLIVCALPHPIAALDNFGPAQWRRHASVPCPLSMHALDN